MLTTFGTLIYFYLYDDRVRYIKIKLLFEWWKVFVTDFVDNRIKQ